MRYHKIFASLVCSLGLAMAAQAAEPQTGLYSGLIFSGTYAPKVSTGGNFGSFTGVPGTTVVSFIAPYEYSAGGATGLQFGYRFNNNVRAELEVQYQFGSIHDVGICIDGVASDCSDGTMALGTSIQTFAQNNGGLTDDAGHSGRHTQIAVLFNVLYDATFFTDATHIEQSWVPFIGFGIGQARLEDEHTLETALAGVITSSNTIKRRETKPSAQGILGFNYFFDSYTLFFIDYRYLSTISKVDYLDKRFQMHTLNMGMDFTFNFD